MHCDISFRDETTLAGSEHRDRWEKSSFFPLVGEDKTKEAWIDAEEKWRNFYFLVIKTINTLRSLNNCIVFPLHRLQSFASLAKLKHRSLHRALSILSMCFCWGTKWKQKCFLNMHTLPCSFLYRQAFLPPSLITLSYTHAGGFTITTRELC